MKQKVLVVGAGGQLGQELQRTVPSDVECAPMTRAQLDIADAADVDSCLSKTTPQLVINAAAYTSVDKAESEPEAAHRGNEAKGFIITDTFRLEDGKLREHWDAIQAINFSTRLLMLFTGGKVANANATF